MTTQQPLPLKNSPKSFKGMILKSLMGLIGGLPFPVIRATGLVVGCLNWWIGSRSVKVALRNIELCYPEYSAQQVRDLARRSCLHSGMVFFEAIWLWQRNSYEIDRLILETQGTKEVAEVLKSGQGVIITGAHLGNWEALLTWGGTHHSASAMYRVPEWNELDEITRKSREKTGVSLITGERGSVRQMLRVLKSGQLFFILSDQRPAENSGVFAPFFHRPAYTMVLIERLIEKTQAQLFFAHVQRIKKGFKLIVAPAQFDTNQPTREDFAGELNRQLAHQINHCPEQFEWSYRRYRPSPEGMVDPYRDL